jgi:ATP-dependent helicase/nuclease subunit B
MSPPEPCPPLEARPKELPVTDIGLWLRNPYAIYAKRILGLRKLDPLDADAGAAEQGSAIHEALEEFLKKTLSKWPKEPLALLLEEGRKAFAVFEDRPQVKAFWWPRFERIARWFVEEEEARRAEGTEPLAAEAQGAMAVAGGAFTLKGRADRIDRLEDGGAEIVDYKTGSVPSGKEVLAGWEPQLPLLALIAAAGGFENLDAIEAGKLSYWVLKGRREDATKTEFKENLAEQQDKAREGLEGLIRRYGDPREPYRAVPRPAFAPDYDDYAHLARLKEWGRERGGKS